MDNIAPYYYVHVGLISYDGPYLCHINNTHTGSLVVVRTTLGSFTSYCTY